MKHSIYHPARQSKESAQSFVLRIWQERPDQLRGTIEHVQSESYRGFERFEQAQQFIERFVPFSESKSNQSFLASWASRTSFKLAFALFAITILYTSVVLLGNLNAISSASATALAAPSLDSILIFLVGAVLGGSTVAIVLRLSK